MKLHDLKAHFLIVPILFQLCFNLFQQLINWSTEAMLFSAVSVVCVDSSRDAQDRKVSVWVKKAPRRVRVRSPVRSWKMTQKEQHVGQGCGPDRSVPGMVVRPQPTSGEEGSSVNVAFTRWALKCIISMYVCTYTKRSIWVCVSIVWFRSRNGLCRKSILYGIEICLGSVSSGCDSYLFQLVYESVWFSVI